MIRLGLLLLILPPLMMLGLYFWELGDVRACQLDGGHWDYVASVCRDSPQEFASWLERAPFFVNGGMMTAVVGLVLCMAGLVQRRKTA
ncbi:MAG: hypothetical protein L0I84_00350 [Halomonas subglaciescola]|nr:hypothetical protein [Halomonas subglaciescola]